MRSTSKTAGAQSVSCLMTGGCGGVRSGGAVIRPGPHSSSQPARRAGRRMGFIFYFISVEG